MAKGKLIIVFREGEIQHHRVLKPTAPRTETLVLSHCATRALSLRVKFYVARTRGMWRLFYPDTPHPRRAFPTQEAAEMWLMYRSG